MFSRISTYDPDSSVYGTEVGECAYGVDIVISGLVSLYAHTWSNIGEKVERPPEGQIQRHVSFSDGCRQWAFEGYSVLLDRVDGSLRDGCSAVDENRGDVYFFPVDRCLPGRNTDELRSEEELGAAHFGSFVYLLDTVCNLWADTCSKVEREGD